MLYGSSAGLLNGRRRADPPPLAWGCRRGRAGTATGSRRVTSTTTTSATSWLARPGCRARRRSGAVQLIFGSPTGLQIDKPRTIRRPDDTYVEFGSRLRAGDIDRDGNLDLVVGSPDRPDRRRPGTACTAMGRRKDRPAAGRWAPTPEEARRRSRSPTSTATGSTTSCRATPIPCRRTPCSAAGRSGCGAAASAGRRARRSRSIRTREFVDGTDDQGDEFGGTLDAGDVDDDGYADMIVGAPGEENESGRGDRDPRRARRVGADRQQRVRRGPARRARRCGTR